MQIRRQRAHSSNLCRRSTDESRHVPRRLLGEKLPLPQGRVFEIPEMPIYTDGGPGVELCGDVGVCGAGLEAERVAAEVDAFILGF